MKKLCALMLILAALGTAAFADDAKVMPKMVGRLYIAPAFAFMTGSYNDNGVFHAYKNNKTAKMFILSGALEFGVTDWITAAVQWTPGWVAWSDLEAAAKSLGYYKKANANDMGDLFVGAKLQFLGPKAPIKSDRFRFAVAGGAKVPLTSGPDFDEAVENMGKNEDATVNKADKHVLATGMRFYFDWQITEKFFINLYNETIIYPIKQGLDKDGPKLAGLKNTLQGYGMPSALTDQLEGEVDYKYSLTFEIEPVYTTSIAQGISLTGGFPVTYTYSPAAEYSLDAPASLLTLTSGIGMTTGDDLLAAATITGASSYNVSLKPNVSVFFTRTPLPLEFKLQYSLPVSGRNSQAQHSINLQVKAYFALPGANLGG